MEIKNIKEASEKFQEALAIRDNTIKTREISLENIEKINKLFKEITHYYCNEIEKGNLEVMNGFFKVLEEGVFNNEQIKQFYMIVIDKGYTVDTPYCYDIGQYFQLNKEKITEYAKTMADNGDIEANYIYAQTLFEKGISKNKEEILKYLKVAADGGHAEASFYYAITLNYETGCEENLEEEVKYFKIAAERGHTEANRICAKNSRNGLRGFEMNKGEAIRYYRKAIDNGCVSAMSEYAEMLQNGEGIEANLEEAKRYYKMAIKMGNLDCFKSSNPNKKILGELLKECREFIYNVAQEEEKYKDFCFEEGKLAAVVFDKNIKRQGFNQAITVRMFQYDEEENLTTMVDSAIHRDTEQNILYGTEYADNGERKITYFCNEEGEVLLEANISNQGELTFDFGEDFFTDNIEENKAKIREAKNKIRKILDGFNNIESFDNELSYLEYAVLELELRKSLYNDIINNIIIKTDCGKGVDDLLAIANESLTERNKDKIYICDFGAGNHNIQCIICNGNFIISNTGKKLENIINKTKIEEIFNEKYPQNVGKLNVKELSILDQTRGNCVETSKIQTINLIAILLKDIILYNKDKNQSISNNLMGYLDNLLGFLEKDIKNTTDFNKFNLSDIFMVKTIFQLEIKILTNLQKTYLVATDKVGKIQEEFFKLAKANELAN